MSNDNFPWTKTEDGWCTEASDLPGFEKARIVSGAVTLPGTNSVVVPIPAFKEVKEVKRKDAKDPSGDLLYWELTYRGVKYTIFND